MNQLTGRKSAAPIDCARRLAAFLAISTSLTLSATETSGPPQAAWAFFDLCGRGKSREALDSAAPILRSRLDLSRLESALGKLGLKDAGPITWKPVKTFADMATVEGTCTPEPGKVVSLLVTLVGDGAAWQVYSACILPPGRFPAPIPLFAPAGPAATKRAPGLPDKKTIVELVRGDLRFFAQIQDSDYLQELYRESGGRARKTPVKSWEMFARLRDRDLSWRMALDGPIHFEGPTSIGPDGVCIANIHVDISPLQLRASYRFVLAAGGWRLGGKGGDLVPDSSEAERLSRETLLRFDEAIRRRSFADFHQSVSEKWKAEVTPAKLEEAFRAFTEKQPVIDGLADAPIVIDPRPIEDSDDVPIQLTGRFKTTPHHTLFTLKYWYENGEWRLFGIDVSLRKP